MKGNSRDFVTFGFSLVEVALQICDMESMRQICDMKSMYAGV